MTKIIWVPLGGKLQVPPNTTINSIYWAFEGTTGFSVDVEYPDDEIPPYQVGDQC